MEMFVLKTIMTFGLVLHLGGPLDAAMVLLGFQEPPAQALRCIDNPRLCQMEVASISIASSQWSVAPKAVTPALGAGSETAPALLLGKNLGLRLSAADAVPNKVIPTHGAFKGEVIAKHAALGAFSRPARVSNEDM